jgi:hypothetical protein
MDGAIEVWEDDGARKSVRSRVSGTLGHHRTLWVGILYAITIIVVITFVAFLR